MKLNKQVKTVQNKKETVVVAKKHDHRQLRNALFVHSLEITKMSNAMEWKQEDTHIHYKQYIGVREIFFLIIHLFIYMYIGRKTL